MTFTPDIKILIISLRESCTRRCPKGFPVLRTFFSYSLYLNPFFLFQSAGSEWKATCRNGGQPVSQPILCFHLIVWNNFPAHISLCGNLGLVPNCGTRRAQPEHTSEKKEINWNCLPYAFTYICFFYYYFDAEDVSQAFV